MVNYCFGFLIIFRIVFRESSYRGVGGSSLCHVQASVPQGSILGLLLFLIYINDIVDDNQANINLFADFTSLSMTVVDPAHLGCILQTDVDKITRWAQKGLVKFNPAKSESLVISRKRFKPDHPSLFMSNIEIPSVASHKHLCFFSNDGSWDIHINKSIGKAWKRIGVMRHLVKEKFRLFMLDCVTGVVLLSSTPVLEKFSAIATL